MAFNLQFSFSLKITINPEALQETKWNETNPLRLASHFSSINLFSLFVWNKGKGVRNSGYTMCDFYPHEHRNIKSRCNLIEFCLISKHPKTDWDISKFGGFQFFIHFSSKILWALIWFFLWMTHDLLCIILMALSPRLSTMLCESYCEFLTQNST